MKILSDLSFSANELLSANELINIKGGVKRFSTQQRLSSSVAPIAIHPTVNAMNFNFAAAPTVNDVCVCYGKTK